MSADASCAVMHASSVTAAWCCGAGTAAARRLTGGTIAGRSAAGPDLASAFASAATARRRKRSCGTRGAIATCECRMHGHCGSSVQRASWTAVSARAGDAHARRTRCAQRAACTRARAGRMPLRRAGPACAPAAAAGAQRPAPPLACAHAARMRRRVPSPLDRGVAADSDAAVPAHDGEATGASAHGSSIAAATTVPLAIAARCATRECARTRPPRPPMREGCCRRSPARVWAGRRCVRARGGGVARGSVRRRRWASGRIGRGQLWQMPI